MLLELGGGTNPHPRAGLVVDTHHPYPSGMPCQDATEAPWRLDRAYPEVDCYRDDGSRWWHLDDGSVDEVYCSHFLEHVPKGQPLLDVVNEVWRVLRPGGSFTAVLPLVGWTDPDTGDAHPVHGWQPHGDPTHVAYWWLPEGVLYLCDGAFRPCADYGLRSFAALGPWVLEQAATAELQHQALGPGHREHPTFWSVRTGWEGVFRVVKP